MQINAILRRPVSTVATVLVIALALAAVALGGGRDNEHPHFLPARLTGAPDLSAVVFSESSKSFVQLVFDRGKITAINASGGTLTVQQAQDGNVWRTQTFTVPSTADVLRNGHHSTLAKLKVGERVRIEQSGPVGGSLAVVRVDAQAGEHDVAFPADND